MSDIYGTDQNHLIGPAIAKHFNPGVFIDMDRVRVAANQFNERLQRFVDISKDGFGDDAPI